MDADTHRRLVKAAESGDQVVLHLMRGAPVVKVLELDDPGGSIRVELEKTDGTKVEAVLPFELVAAVV